MKKVLILLLAIFNTVLGFGQSSKKTDSVKCQQNWQWSDLIKIRKGTVIFYEQPDFLCGRVSNASVAIIRIENGDTIRIICPCDIKNINDPSTIKMGDKIIIQPVVRNHIDYIPLDPFCNSSLRTCYGRILKATN